MTENIRLESIEKKLDGHGNTLCEIKTTLNDIAIQNERISAIQLQLASIWKKYDELTGPKDGVITDIVNFQASCPRNTILTHIRWLWAVIVPLIGTQVIIAIKLLK